MRSVFGHLLAPRGEQGLGLFLADQIGKELARITAIQNGNEVGTEFGRNFLGELWADPFELFPGQNLCDTGSASGNPLQDVSGLELAAPAFVRSEERRVGKECVRTCIYRWSPYH